MSDRFVQFKGLWVRPDTDDKSMVTDALTKDYPFANTKDEIVLDCGANVGAFTKRALDMGAKKVYAVEPWGPTLEVLRKNFGDHPQVEIFPYAVSKTDVVLTLPKENRLGGVSGFVKHRKPVLSQKAKGVSLEDLIKRTGATFLKLDIEGAEWDVLPCDLGTVNTLCGELHTMSIPNRKRAFEFFIWLEENGFWVSHIKDGPNRNTLFERILAMTFHSVRRNSKSDASNSTPPSEGGAV